MDWFLYDMDLRHKRVNVCKTFAPEWKHIISTQCVKRVGIRIFSGPYFPALGLNTERYSVSLRIQSELGKTQTRKTLNMDTFHTSKIRLILYKKVFKTKFDLILCAQTCNITKKYNQYNINVSYYSLVFTDRLIAKYNCLKA